MILVAALSITTVSTIVLGILDHKEVLGPSTSVILKNDTFKILNASVMSAPIHVPDNSGANLSVKISSFSGAKIHCFEEKKSPQKLLKNLINQTCDMRSKILATYYILKETNLNISINSYTDEEDCNWEICTLSELELEYHTPCSESSGSTHISCSDLQEESYKLKFSDS